MRKLDRTGWTCLVRRHELTRHTAPKYSKCAVNALMIVWPPMLGIQEIISRKLTETFTPVSLKVLNESHEHAGHRHGGEETHFRIYIVAEAFKGKIRLARHRLINDLLADELKGGVHALAIHATAPGEV